MTNMNPLLDKLYATRDDEVTALRKAQLAKSTASKSLPRDDEMLERALDAQHRRRDPHAR
jgi:hypothetical protein